MSIKRITISVPDDTAERIKKAANGIPVSAWVTGRHTRVVDLTHAIARVLGRMLSVARSRDRVDAHVVLLARERGWSVLSSDAAELRAIDPTLLVEEI